jgi:CRP-like cAMP-binding protein
MSHYPTQINDLLIILASQLPTAYDSLAPHLKRVFLHKDAILYDVGETPDRVWFITRGAVSLFANVRHRVIEVAMIGREGAVGLSGIARTNSIPLYAQMKIEGEAHEIDVRIFHQVLRQNSEAYDLIFDYVNGLFGRLALLSVCNRFHSTRQRLASKLLLMQKCMRSDSFQMTHASLAEAIGVARSVVTETMLKFRREGWVGAERNRITIIKSGKLKYTACSCHAFVSREKFFPSLSPPS